MTAPPVARLESEVVAGLWRRLVASAIRQVPSRAARCYLEYAFGLIWLRNIF
jgi:hypothetical protein